MHKSGARLDFKTASHDFMGKLHGFQRQSAHLTMQKPLAWNLL
jgi:hypothetical protein